MTKRLVSLDAFRGAVIALMVLVNTPGDGRFVYGPLQHAEWHGWTLTDTVFPSFAWIIGVAITLSLGKRREQGASRASLLRPILRRGAILFALGLFLYGFPEFDLATWRILGVLQRLAICYVVSSLIYLWFSWKGQVVWIAGLLLSYTLLMSYAPVPGYGAGRLDVEGNFAHYVDRIVLGAHNYGETKTWDPEGVVSTLPAIATTLLGLLAGHLLRRPESLGKRLQWMAAAGVILLIAGLIWDQWIPINKKLWTPAFTFFMAGLDFLVFAAFAWIIDGLGHQRWPRPLVILGMNAIAIYMVSEVAITLIDMAGLRSWLFENVFRPLASPRNASLLFAIAYVWANWLVAWWMYRRGWFLRI